MDFKDVVILPGFMVHQNPDGSIKAKVPGLFNNIDKMDKWPDIQPWHSGAAAGSYSKLNNDDDQDIPIWVMYNKKNREEIFWLRKDVKVPEPKIGECLISESNKTLESICSTLLTNGDSACLYLSDDNGWIMKKGDAEIQIRPDDSIKIDTGMSKRVIDINSNGISLGSEGESGHPAVHGDTLVQVLLLITTLLKKLAIAAEMNPHTVALGNVIDSCLGVIIGSIPLINSNNVTLD